MIYNSILYTHFISSRTKFMVEMINDLKNNKIKKKSTVATQTNVSSETVTRLKKYLGNLGKKRHGKFLL
jgi:nucleolar MIF4G domain-containing protein 1